MGMLRYQARRAVDAWWGRDLAVYRRLVRRGQVVYGQASYGIPSLYYFEHDPTRLIVGNYCSIAGNYLLGGQHAHRQVTTFPLRTNLGLPGAGTDGTPSLRGDIVVGSDVWSGYGCWVTSGVTIGDGAVVATGAVVTKDVPPFAIVGGTPARVIGYRHTEEQRTALLRIRWWDWSAEDVRAAVPLLASEDVDRFIAYAEDRRDTAITTDT